MENQDKEVSQTLYVLQGLPGSGKSTKAKQLIRPNAIRVNRDLFRAMLYFYDKKCDRLDFSYENIIEKIELEAIRTALKGGYSVIVDDVNYSPKTLNKLLTIAKEHAIVMLIVPVDTPVDECIKRDADRKDTEGSIGEVAIRKLANIYGRV